MNFNSSLFVNHHINTIINTIIPLYLNMINYDVLRIKCYDKKNIYNN